MHAHTQSRLTAGCVFGTQILRRELSLVSRGDQKLLATRGVTAAKSETHAIDHRQLSTSAYFERAALALRRVPFRIAIGGACGTLVISATEILIERIAHKAVLPALNAGAYRLIVFTAICLAGIGRVRTTFAVDARMRPTTAWHEEHLCTVYARNGVITFTVDIGPRALTSAEYTAGVISCLFTGPT